MDKICLRSHFSHPAAELSYGDCGGYSGVERLRSSLVTRPGWYEKPVSHKFADLGGNPFGLVADHDDGRGDHSCSQLFGVHILAIQKSTVHIATGGSDSTSIAANVAIMELDPEYGSHR